MKGVAAIVIIYEVDAPGVTDLRADIERIGPELRQWLDDLILEHPRAAVFSLRVGLDEDNPEPSPTELQQMAMSTAVDAMAGAFNTLHETYGWPDPPKALRPAGVPEPVEGFD